MIKPKKRLRDGKRQEDTYQLVVVQKYASIDGFMAGNSFINILSDRGKVSPGSPQRRELDGPISGYFLRYYLDFYQKARKNCQDKNLPSYVVHFCQAFDAVVLATIEPPHHGSHGLTVREIESLLHLPRTEKDRYERYRAYVSGRYKNSENLWKTKIDEMSSKKRYVIISDATRVAFSLGQYHAYANVTQHLPEDIYATTLAEKILDHYKSKLAESDMKVTLEEWTTAYRRGFIKLWEALIRGNIIIPKLQEKIGNRPIPPHPF